MIEKTLDAIPAGVYRIQFSELDLWGTTVSKMPESGEVNTTDILIGDFDETFVNIMKHGIQVAFLTDDRNSNLYCIYSAPAPLITKIEQVKGTDIEIEYRGLFYQTSADGTLVLNFY